MDRSQSVGGCAGWTIPGPGKSLCLQNQFFDLLAYKPGGWKLALSDLGVVSFVLGNTFILEA